ncbi:MAG: ABC transporter ATP-binding protein [Clostridia bacterium]|nr:ABC transporter ATP-binding protein [Clostridia bacterium]
MKMLLRYLAPVRWQIALGVSIKFIGSIVELFLPSLLAYLLDTVVPQAKIDGDMGPIFFYSAMMLVCAGVAWVANITANRMAASTTRDAVRNLRQDLFDKTIRLSDARINAFSVPTLEMRLTGDTYNIHRMVGMIQRMGIRAPILLLGGVVMTATMEPVLTLVLLAVLPLIALVILGVTRKGVPLYDLLQQKTDDMVRVVRENITGIRVVKALSKTTYEKARFEQINTDVSDAETTAGVTMALTNPVMSFLLNGGLTFVILAGAYRVNDGLTQAGTLIAFMSYFTIILNAMMAVTRMFIMCSKGLASANRIAQVLDTPPEAEELTCHGSGKIHNSMLAFENVSFSYNGKKNNLEDVSFSLPKGGTLGIIGATGSGKSTLVKLMMRFYDAGEGTVYLDGRDIKDIPLEELRRKFGVAMQNDFLYADTVEDNIRFERSLEQADVQRAAEMAQAADFIAERKNGYKDLLTQAGHNLSGGQRQRLLVARALAGNPEILILDDSSSALDYRTDAAMRGAIAEMRPRPTTVVVAQRVSSVMNSDLILVLEDGKVLAQGTHAELMDCCDVYREIAETQMGGERIGSTC